MTTSVPDISNEKETNVQFVVRTKSGGGTLTAYSYPLYVRERPDWDEFAAVLKEMTPDHITLVADWSLPHPFVTKVFHKVKTRVDVPAHLIWVNASEPGKTMATALDIAYQARRSGGGTHASVVIALGGGLVGNVAGLASALVVRGLKLVHIPTTLLAGTDSVLSLKQGVNGELADGALVKNLLGVFKAPECVFLWLDLWKTLPADEIRAGLNELIKNVIAIHPHLYETVFAFLKPEADYTLEDYHQIFRWCIEAKQEVMREDAHEQGTALILEFGHTFGHALEALTGIKHGLAVGLGMRVAAQISLQRGYFQAGEAEKIRALLERNGAPLFIPRPISIDEIMARIAEDNKIGYLPKVAGQHAMVLLQRLGVPMLHNGLPLTYVGDDELRTAIAAMLEPEPGASSSQVSECSAEEGKNVSA